MLEVFTSKSQNLTIPVKKFACNSPTKQYSKTNLFQNLHLILKFLTLRFPGSFEANSSAYS